MSFTVEKTSVHWSPANEDSSGKTTRFCTFKAKDDKGDEKTYKVTVKYNKKGLQDSGYQGDMDASIQKVIDAAMATFPKLVGTTITYPLHSNDDSDTKIEKHANKNYEGKTLKEIKDLDAELYNEIKKVSTAFHNVFKDLKKSTPTQIDVSESENKDKKASRPTPPTPPKPSKASRELFFDEDEDLFDNDKHEPAPIINNDNNSYVAQPVN